MTERTLCVWFPDWPLRRPDAPSDQPAQTISDRNLVTAVNDLAREAGARPGMRRREAEGICPTIVTLDADPGAEWAAFEPVVLAVEDLVPRVEVAHAGLLFVPVRGAIRYYGGEPPLVKLVAKTVASAAGCGGRIGLADGPFAARLAADLEPRIVEDTTAFLAGLDVSVLGIEEIIDTFRWLGIGTLGDLAALPRPAVASRFGEAGLRAHRVASGEDRPVRARTIPEDVRVEERFSPPLIDMEQAAFVTRAMAASLVELLAPHGGAPHRIEVHAVSAAGRERSRTWRNANPFTEAEIAERVRWQLRAWVEGGGIPGGLVQLHISPADISDRGRQLQMGEDAASELEVHRALIRTQSLVGPDAVLQARPQGGRDPGERVQWRRWGEEPEAPARDPEAPWPGRLPSPSPALVPPQPTPLEVEWEDGFPTRVRLGSRWEPTLSWAGPWRRTGRWWEGSPSADRYQVVTSAGAFLIEVVESRSFLGGVYD